jgi:hypothetical protein
MNSDRVTLPLLYLKGLDSVIVTCNVEFNMTYGVASKVGQLPKNNVEIVCMLVLWTWKLS